MPGRCLILPVKYYYIVLCKFCDSYQINISIGYSLKLLLQQIQQRRYDNFEEQLNDSQFGLKGEIRGKR